MKKILAVVLTVFLIPAALFAEAGFRVFPSSVSVVGTLNGNGSGLTGVNAASYSEIDPTFSTSAAYGITAGDISNWTTKLSTSGNGSGLSGITAAQVGAIAIGGGTDAYINPILINSSQPQLIIGDTGGSGTGGLFNITAVPNLLSVLLANVYTIENDQYSSVAGPSAALLFTTGDMGSIGNGDVELEISTSNPANTKLTTQFKTIFTAKAATGFLGVGTTNAKVMLDVNGAGAFVSSVTASEFWGDGSHLTGIASGDVALASTQTFTGQNTFNGTVMMNAALNMNGHQLQGTGFERIVVTQTGTTVTASCSNGSKVAMGGSCSNALSATPMDNTLNVNDYTCATSISATITATVVCMYVN